MCALAFPFVTLPLKTMAMRFLSEGDRPRKEGWGFVDSAPINMRGEFLLCACGVFPNRDTLKISSPVSSSLRLTVFLKESQHIQ